MTAISGVAEGSCSPLVVRTSFEDHKRVITLYGELDLANSMVVERQLELAERDESCESVVVDLQALEFIDSAGIELLLRARVRDRGGRLRVITGDSGPVLRMIELTGIEAELDGRLIYS